MKKSLRLKGLVAALLPTMGFALFSPAYAQVQSTPPVASKQGQTQNAAMRDLRLSQLIGKDVRNAQGEDLGDIRDVVLDVNNGRVHYVVLSFGGFMGMGNKLFAYPMKAFSLSADRDELILNVARERLSNAPGFEMDRYPDWGAADYRDRVDRYFGPTYAVEARPNMRLVRGSELLGKDVNDPNGRDLGEIQDVVLNVRNGEVHYTVLEFDQSWSLRDKLFAFPLRAFKQGANWGDDFVLNISKSTLNDVPGFDKNKWPDLRDSTWTRDVDRYLISTRIIPLPSAANDAQWQRLDSNKDGSLSQDELKGNQKLYSGWKTLDQNGDGKVTRAEFDRSSLQ